MNGRTVTRRKIPKWRRENEFILDGYRRTKADLWEILASLTYLHNETVNVYTHLVGALLLPLAATNVMRMLSQPQLINVSETDYTMFRIFFCSAEFCLICSTIYHLVSSYSRKVERFWHQIDLLGIVIAIVGTFIPSIYYIFFCEDAERNLHWSIVSTSEGMSPPFPALPDLCSLTCFPIRLQSWVLLLLHWYASLHLEPVSGGRRSWQLLLP